MDAARLKAILNTIPPEFMISYYTVYSLVAIATYVLMALSLYTIAKRRFFFGRGAWLAWVPFAQFWVLARLSDDYQCMVWSRIKKKRIIMLVLNIIQLIAVVVIVQGIYWIIEALQNAGITDEQSFENMVRYIQSQSNKPYYYMSSEARKLIETVTKNYDLIVICAVVTFVTAVTYAVFYYKALYDLYRSCDLQNEKVFLVLSILFAFTIPVFLMICRKHEKCPR